MSLSPQRRMLIFNVACVDFIVLGLVAILLFVGKYPLSAILTCAVVSIIGLVTAVAFGLILLLNSLTKKTWHKILEKTPPQLDGHLEEGCMHTLKDSFLEILNEHWTNDSTYLQPVPRSSPISIPRKQQIQGCQLSKFPFTSLGTRFLRWRAKYANPSTRRCKTTSDSYADNRFCIFAKHSRPKTLSESAADDERFRLSSVVVESVKPLQHISIDTKKIQSLSGNPEDAQFNLTSVVVEKTTPTNVSSRKSVCIEIDDD